MVARSFSEFFNNWTTAFSLFCFDSAAFAISSSDNEKKATSAPDIKADRNNKKNKIAILISNHKLKFGTTKKMGSGSKFELI